MSLKTYDYPTLEACDRFIRQGIDDMQQKAADTRREVQQLVGQGWGGDAATGYETVSQQLDKQIDDKQTTLFNIVETLKRGVGDMQDTDAAGKRRMQS